MANPPEATVAPRHYLPEIHDLHPSMADRLDELIGVFPAEARDKIAFSVVPNWMGTCRLDAHGDFVRRLSELPGSMVLHGWTHTRGPDLLNWLVYGLDNRSEFPGLSADDTESRLDRGLATFAAAGLDPPRWFCAPRWQPNAHLGPALRRAGFLGVLARWRIERFDAAPVRIAPLNFDEGARAPIVAAARLARRRTIADLLSADRSFRFVLHPGDLDHAATMAQIRALARTLAERGWAPLSLSAATT